MSYTDFEHFSPTGLGISHVKWSFFYLCSFFMLLRRGSWPNTKTFIYCSLIAFNRTLHTILQMLDWVYLIGSTLLRVPVDCIQFHIPNWMVGRSLVLPLGVQNLFFSSCFPPESLRFTLSIAFPPDWLQSGCNRLNAPPHFPMLVFECAIAL